jgi:hypothetical protein
MNPESYEWGTERINVLDPLPYPDAIRTVDFMNDQEILALGFKSEHELQDAINHQFMLSED